MTIQDLIKSPIIRQCIENSKEAKTQKREAAYNLFTLSSYNNEKENFHSDVISSLLNPEGLHHEGYKFLNLFLDFLNDKYNFTIDKSHYKISSVIVEIGNNESRMDILIKGEGRCILIENKMNNAPDMDDQIDRYYSLLTNWKLEIDGIIYLTLDGIKNAPTPVIQDAQLRLKSIGAYTNNDNDLVNGWLLNCLNNTSNDDSKSLIHQYIKLIKHLNSSAMEKKSLEDFYQLINTSEATNSANEIAAFLKELPFFRINVVSKKLLNYYPFTTSKKYSIYPGRLFEGYSWQNCNFQLQLICNSDNSISIHFFNLTSPRTDFGHNIVREIFTNTGLIKDFQVYEYNHGFKKIFTLKEFETLQELDNAVLACLENLFNKLRELN